MTQEKNKECVATPRTDAAEKDLPGGRWGQIVCSDFARTLERELAALRLLEGMDAIEVSVLGSFLQGGDIPETVNAARGAVVRRMLTAEREVERLSLLISEGARVLGRVRAESMAYELAAKHNLEDARRATEYAERLRAHFNTILHDHSIVVEDAGNALRVLCACGQPLEWAVGETGAEAFVKHANTVLDAALDKNPAPEVGVERPEPGSRTRARGERVAEPACTVDRESGASHSEAGPCKTGDLSTERPCNSGGSSDAEMMLRKIAYRHRKGLPPINDNEWPLIESIGARNASPLREQQ